MISRTNCFVYSPLCRGTCYVAFRATPSESLLSPMPARKRNPGSRNDSLWAVPGLVYIAMLPDWGCHPGILSASHAEMLGTGLPLLISAMYAPMPWIVGVQRSMSLRRRALWPHGQITACSVQYTSLHYRWWLGRLVNP